MKAFFEIFTTFRRIVGPLIWIIFLELDELGGCLTPAKYNNCVESAPDHNIIPRGSKG
uniref:Uncharacterized protein n=1 Tax=Rhodnius prolixus TaxID=13249 RepID=T1HNQ6_RHOPR